MASDVFNNPVIFRQGASFPDGASMDYPAGSIVNDDINSSAAIARSKLAQETGVFYPLLLQEARVHDAPASFLPTSAGSDDLGYSIGTFGTTPGKIVSGDAASTTVTQYARWPFVAVPAEYDSAETFNIRVYASMQTVSDGTATVDVQAYLLDTDGTYNGSPTDLVSTSATSINSATSGAYDFAITATNLEPGKLIDVRVMVAITDAATGSGVIADLEQVGLRLDIKG